MNVPNIGTVQERGILLWRKELGSEENDEADHEAVRKCYDLPFVTKFLRKWKWTYYIPLCPTFDGKCGCGKRKRADSSADQTIGAKVNGSTTYIHASPVDNDTPQGGEFKYPPDYQAEDNTAL